MEPHRVTVFENLWVGDARICHVRVDSARATKPSPRSRPAADGFVVPEASIAEKDVVHRALAARRAFEGEEERVDDALTRFDVAADDGRRFRRVRRGTRARRCFLPGAAV